MLSRPVLGALAYRALDESAKEIRLLRMTFDPERETAVPKLELLHSELQPGLNFIAISYAWGSQEVQKTVTIDEHAVSVGENLYALLKQLPTLPRHSQVKRHSFWIDAICINQQDDVEKSVQIRRMSELYASARYVLAWLGPEGHDSETILGMVVGGAGETRQSTTTVLRREVIEQAPKISTNLARLFMRPFFTRAW
jgi:hypothetical protein